MTKPINQSQWNALGERSPDEVFSTIYEETSRPVWTLCFRILKSEEDASDAFQGAYARLLQLVQNESQPPREHSIESLMLRLAVLEADRIRKHRGRRQEKEVTVEHLDYINEGTPSLKEQLAQQQLREKLGHLIDELPENLRLPVTLHYLDGMTQTQISTALGVSQSAINQRLKRALDALRPKCQLFGLQELSTALATIVGLQTLLSPPSAMAAKTVLASAIQISQSAGFTSLPLSALTPAKGVLLGGKALLATVASVMIIVSITLATAVGGNKEKKAEVTNNINIAQTTQQNQVDIDSGASTEKVESEVVVSEEGSTDSDTEQTNTVVVPSDSEPTIKVVWQGTEEPVEGASLLLIDSETTETSNAEGIIPLASILEDGGSEAGRKLRLSHPEGVTWSGNVPKVEDEPTVIELQRAGILSGTLAYEDGGKLARNETIKFYQNVRIYDVNIKVQETKTDEKGRYKFYITDPGKCRIRAINEVYIDVTKYGQRLEMNLAAGEDTEAPLLLLQQGASIYGMVKDEKGRPIEGVQFYHNYLPKKLLGTSDKSGEYSLSPLYPNKYTLRAKHKEYVPKAFILTLDKKESKELPISLEPGFKIEPLK